GRPGAGRPGDHARLVVRRRWRTAAADDGGRLRAALRLPGNRAGGAVAGPRRADGDAAVTATATGASAAVRPMVDRATAMRLAAGEYQRVTDQLRGLSGRQWEAATCCPGWDVRLMACHVLGMAGFAGSPADQAPH